MTSIRLRPEATAEQVLATLRETFEARDYHWEQTDARHATAIEGVASAPGAEPRTRQRLRVSISVGPDAERLVLVCDIEDAEYARPGERHGARLGLRFRIRVRYCRIIDAVRGDIVAAGLR